VRRLSDRELFREDLARRFLLRFHMTLILVATAAAGALFSKLLLLLGLRGLGPRWALAVVAAYAAFFGLVRLWVEYTRSGGGSALEEADVSGLLDVADLAADGTRAAARGLRAVRASSGSSSGSGGGLLDGLDADEGGLILLVLGLVLVVLLGAGAWLVVQAPAILGEAAFEVLLAAGMLRSVRRAEAAGFVDSLWRGTRWPFLIVLLSAVAAGLVVQRLCPAATKLSEALRLCVG
jgi:hypothetical protein